VTAEQIIVLALLVAAFIAGYVARDPPRRARAEEAEPDVEPQTDARADAERAYDEAVDAWIDGRDTRPHIDALRAAAAQAGEPAFRDAAALLSLSLRGHPLDAVTSRALDAIEERWRRGESNP
jgi:hypothetical protein